MKTFEEIYNELQNTDNEELNNSWEKAKKESKKAKKIAGIICFLIDIVFIILLFKNAINLKKTFFIVLIMPSIIAKGAVPVAIETPTFPTFLAKLSLSRFFHNFLPISLISSRRL